jgi:hypothetical protein
MPRGTTPCGRPWACHPYARLAAREGPPQRSVGQQTANKRPTILNRAQSTRPAASPPRPPRIRSTAKSRLPPGGQRPHSASSRTAFRCSSTARTRTPPDRGSSRTGRPRRSRPLWWASHSGEQTPRPREPTFPGRQPQSPGRRKTNVEPSSHCPPLGELTDEPPGPLVASPPLPLI